jgi:type I restriction enzyme M protein
MEIFKPHWFSDDHIMISTAPTCGLTKGGRLLAKIDKTTGNRIQVLDEDTNELIDDIDDQLLADALALRSGEITETLSFIPATDVKVKCAVPIYYDRHYAESFRKEMAGEKFKDFTYASLGELLKKRAICIRNGHGSPSHNQRVGEVPYIKVSDLRAGLVNINPTNRVPLSVAKVFWKGDASGFKEYDLICPERTSKNIGDFCLLMPGQEQVVATKEVIVIRADENANFDQFYLLWAMTLKCVRDQWRRIVFMQTNREDVGKRFLEIEIPIPKSEKIGFDISNEFREYFTTLAKARGKFAKYLSDSGDHHFYFTGASDEDAEQVDDLSLRESSLD